VLSITDDRGNVVRTLDGSVEAGLQTTVWDMRHAPAYTNDSGDDGPAGPQVMPGSYIITLTVGDVALTEPVVIRADPRATTNSTALASREQGMMDAFDLVSPTRDASQALDRVKNQLDDAKKLLESLEDTPADLVEEADSLLAKLEPIREDMTTLGRTGRIGGNIARTFGPPTSDQRWQIDRGWELLERVTDRINALVNTDLPAFYEALNDRGIRPEPGDALTMPTRRR